MSIFAATLRRLMTKKNISESEMAKALDISQMHLCNLMSDYVKPDETVLTKIAGYFDITQSYITGDVYNADIDEPRYTYQRSICVPVVNSSTTVSSIIKDSEIVDYAFYTPPLPRGEKDYVALKMEYDVPLCDRVLKKSDVAVINTSTQYVNNDIVAFSKRNKPVDFRRYTRSGPTVTLYSFTDAKPFIFRIGDPDYRIIGVLKAVHSNL